jgi:hypothetical protein
MTHQNSFFLEKKYLVCIGNTDSHKGALNFLRESLKNKKDIVIEFFISAAEEVDGGFFASNPDVCNGDSINKDVVEKILCDVENFLQKKLSNKIIKTIECGDIGESLKKKIQSDNSILTIILGSSTRSKNISGIIGKICNLVMIPIIIIPQDITNEQIIRMLN